ncbi:MAG: hypothetical protein FWC03_03515 [Treponema sp.]|nr:hypothetical protein [Treponema sp.]
MAETEQTGNYVEVLEKTLNERGDWIEKEELGNLKDELRTFQSSYASLYNIFLKKKLLNEDPYKQETKISELVVPDSSGFNEAKKLEQLSIRLSNYDSQLDFLVNFYQLGVDYLNLDRIKRIVGLVRYVDWTSLTPDSTNIMTGPVAQLSINSKAGVDAITLSVIGESLSKLSKLTAPIMTILKNLNIYYRESYKLGIRQKVTQSMSANEATLENIRKKVSSAMPGSPFYKELIDEIIKEDYSSSGSDLREAIINTLKVPQAKAKAVKPQVNFKNILLDGIQVIGGAGAILNEIGAKLDENESVLQNRKKNLMEKIKELIRQITNAPPEEVVYIIEFIDASKGLPAKEKVQFHQLRDEMNKKAKILCSFVRGPAYQKLSAMTEEQIISYLERNIKDVQSYHKTLNALDDYFKANVVPEDKDKIKGIKPELSAMKNSFVKANQLRYEYSAQKEEDEQFKRLGVSPISTDNPVPLPADNKTPAPPPAGAPAK